MERKHYLWTAGNSPISVYLAADVIARLKLDAAANSAAPEIGGILLGRRRSDNSISIENFELVSSEHRRGMTFTLSGDDKRRLVQRIRSSHRGLRPVGSFRTHRRLGLYMDQYDFELMSEFFPSSNDVMLLVRPTDWRAGFFVWEEGDIFRQKSHAEFPFDPTVLPLVACEPVLAAARQQTHALSPTQKLPTLMKVGLIAATAGLAAVLAFYSHEHRGQSTQGASSPAASLTAKQIEPPSVASVNPPVYPDASQPDNQYELHVRISDRPSPFAAPPVHNEPVASTSLSTSASRTPQVVPLPQPATPPEILQPVQSANNIPLPVVARAILRPVRPTLVTEVSLEPTQPGVLRRGLHRVPVLNIFERHNYKSGSNFSPARPVREVKPTLPEDLPEETPPNPDVDVKVWIDDSGQVTKAELLSDHVEPQIAGIASNAACKWTFSPTRLSDRPVPSEMVMHFRFVPKQIY